jgi:hypothetical protein
MLLRCESLEPPMSQLGHNRTLRGQITMSALPPKADIDARRRNVCFGPKADSCTAANCMLFSDDGRR